MNFQAQNSHISPLFKKPSGLKFKDKINLENIIRISKSINNLLPPLLSSSSFKYSSDTLNCETSWSSHVNLHKTSYRTNIYGKNSVTVSAVKSWNKGQNNLKNISLRLSSPKKIKLSNLMNISKIIELECFCSLLSVFISIIVLICCKEMIFPMV